MRLQFCRPWDVVLDLWEDVELEFTGRRNRKFIGKIRRWRPAAEIERQLVLLQDCYRRRIPLMKEYGHGTLWASTVPRVTFATPPIGFLVEGSPQASVLAATSLDGGESFAELCAYASKQLVGGKRDVLRRTLSRFNIELNALLRSHNGCFYVVPFRQPPADNQADYVLRQYSSLTKNLRASPLLYCESEEQLRDSFALLFDFDQELGGEGEPTRKSRPFNPIFVIDESRPMKLDAFPVIAADRLPRIQLQQYANFLNGVVVDDRREQVAECSLASGVLLRTHARHEDSIDHPGWVDRLAHACHESVVPFGAEYVCQEEGSFSP